MMYQGITFKQYKRRAIWNKVFGFIIWASVSVPLAYILAYILVN